MGARYAGGLFDAAERVLRNHMHSSFCASRLREYDLLVTSGTSVNLACLTQLSEAAMISSGAITNRIDGLERAPSVECRPDRRDLGAKLVGRTKAGRGVIDPTIDAPCE